MQKFAKNIIQRMWIYLGSRKAHLSGCSFEEELPPAEHFLPTLSIDSAILHVFAVELLG